MDHKKLLQWCNQYFTELLKPMGYEIVEVEYEKEAHGNVLRFYIDHISDDICTIEDCEAVSEIISDKLDIEDPIAESYYLEVSTSGIDREFRFPKDYRRNIDKKVIVKLFMEIDGKKEWTGILKDFDENEIFLETKKEEISITRDKISSIKLSLF